MGDPTRSWLSTKDRAREFSEGNQDALQFFGGIVMNKLMLKSIFSVALMAGFLMTVASSSASAQQRCRTRNSGYSNNQDYNNNRGRARGVSYNQGNDYDRNNRQSRDYEYDRNRPSRDYEYDRNRRSRDYEYDNGNYNDNNRYGDSNKTRGLKRTGIGAAIGAAGGGLLGGRKGAVIGGLAGGVGGFIYHKGKENNRRY